MLGMMNNGHGNDSDLFYSARKISKSGRGGEAMEKLRRIFGTRMANNNRKTSTTKGKAASADDQMRHIVIVMDRPTAEMGWAKLMVTKRLARRTSQMMKKKPTGNGNGNGIIQRRRSSKKEAKPKGKSGKRINPEENQK